MATAGQSGTGSHSMAFHLRLVCPGQLPLTLSHPVLFRLPLGKLAGSAVTRRPSRDRPPGPKSVFCASQGQRTRSLKAGAAHAASLIVRFICSQAESSPSPRFQHRPEGHWRKQRAGRRDERSYARCKRIPCRIAKRSSELAALTSRARQRKSVKFRAGNTLFSHYCPKVAL